MTNCGHDNQRLNQKKKGLEGHGCGSLNPDSSDFVIGGKKPLQEKQPIHEERHFLSIMNDAMQSERSIIMEVIVDHHNSNFLKPREKSGFFDKKRKEFLSKSSDFANRYSTKSGLGMS